MRGGYPRSFQMRTKKALLIVDVQNDFCPRGALGVSQGDRIIPNINKYIKIFSEAKLPIFATRDWHPKKTKHFKKFGGIWAVHCVQDTRGAQFHPKLKLPKDVISLYKGMNPEEDSYSSFQAQDAQGVGFINLLKILRIEEIYICGLATDYCVKYTSMDALKYGFKVRVLSDAIKGVNLKPKDSEAALGLLAKLGAKLTNLKQAKEELCN